MIDKEYKKYKTNLDQWVKSLSITIVNTENEEIKEVLSMTYNELSILDIDTLNRYLFNIYRHLVYIQDKTNECKTFINWCNQIRNKIHDYTDSEKLNRWKNIAQNRITRIEYICRRIEMMCKPIENLIFSKRRA